MAQYDFRGSLNCPYSCTVYEMSAVDEMDPPVWSCSIQISVYIQYFAAGIIELVRINEFLIL